jgi:Flp pilus assembly pilin Flp
MGMPRCASGNAGRSEPKGPADSIRDRPATVMSLRREPSGPMRWESEEPRANRYQCLSTAVTAFGDEVRAFEDGDCHSMHCSGIIPVPCPAARQARADNQDEHPERIASSCSLRASHQPGEGGPRRRRARARLDTAGPVAQGCRNVGGSTKVSAATGRYVPILGRLSNRRAFRTFEEPAARGRDECQPSLAKGGNVFSGPHREEGQGLAEYALILSLIAMVAVSALMFVSGSLTGLLSTIGSGL